MEEKIVIAIVSALAGSLLTIYLKARMEQKKALKEALFYLLEIWHIARVSVLLDSKKLLLMFLENFGKHYPSISISDEERAQMEKQFVQFINACLKPTYSGQGETLNSSYLSSVRKLSSDAPILAFELTGNSNLQALLVALDQYKKETEDRLANEEAKVLFEEFFAKVNQLVYLDALKELEHHLKRLGIRISIGMWIAVSWKLWKLKRYQKKIFKNLLTDFIDRILKDASTDRA